MVEGFTIDIAGATVTGLEIDDQTATVTLEVPVADVALTFGDTRLERREK